MGLGDYLKLGTGEKKSGGWRRDSILSNAVEAIIGAIFLDSDIDTCRTVVLTLFDNFLAELSLDKLEKDPKTELQEYLQAKKLSLPSYNVISETGDAHARVFTVACEIEGIGEQFTAHGKSKRNAEQTAAGKALEFLLQDD